MKPLMKRAAVRCFFLLPGLLCALLGTGLLWSSAAAHAVPSQTSLSHQAHYAVGQNCPYGNAEMDLLYNDQMVGAVGVSKDVVSSTNATIDQVVCLGSYYKGLHPAAATAVNSGSYTMDFDWYDCVNGARHHLHLPPGTLMMPGLGHGLNNGWAGCSYMSPDNIILSGPGVSTTYHQGTTCAYGMAEMDDYWGNVGCLIPGHATDFKNITVVNTGSHTVQWTWIDPLNGVHGLPPNYVIKSPGTLLRMSSANGGFAYMKYAVNITIF